MRWLVVAIAVPRFIAAGNKHVFWFKAILAAVVIVATLFLIATRQAGVARATATLPPVRTSLPPIRIMALGDSITAGVAAGGGPDAHSGYRSRLIDLLQSNDYDFVMVGSRTDYSNDLKFPEHEGWPGYVLRSYPSDPAGQLYGALVHSAILDFHPNVVLLMAGTNDLLRYEDHDAGYTLPNIKHNMDLVINQIFTLDPHVTVIVAGVVDSPRVSHSAVVSFDEDPNDGLVALVTKYRTRGFSISLAPGMDRAVPRTTEYFPDGIHPSGADGYDRVANVWYGALQPVLAIKNVDAVRSHKQAKP